MSLGEVVRTELLVAFGVDNSRRAQCGLEVGVGNKAGDDKEEVDNMANDKANTWAADHTPEGVLVMASAADGLHVASTKEHTILNLGQEGCLG